MGGLVGLERRLIAQGRQGQSVGFSADVCIAPKQLKKQVLHIKHSWRNNFTRNDNALNCIACQYHRGKTMANFSSRMKELRTERKMTQQDMADTLGLRVRSYQCYEYNEAYPDVPVLIAIADYFDVSLDYLVGRSDVRERQ